MRSAPSTLLTCGLFCLISNPAESDTAAPIASRPALTADGHHVLEGTDVPPPWSWRAALAFDGQTGSGPADDAALLRGRLLVALAFPWRLELALAMPVGGVVASRGPFETGVSRGSGLGPGDLEAAVLWTVLPPEQRGAVGLLLGAIAIAPTGNQDLGLGEQGFAVEPFVSLAVEAFATSLQLNLGYKVRTERIATPTLEQDDEFLWRLGLRVPRQDDVAWTLFAEGAVGVATDEGRWPSRKSRPVLVGGGVDLPATRHGRFGAYVELGLDGATAPSVLLGLAFQLGPVRPDEDQDGVGAFTDECAVLKEDRDGFEDQDGCPDLDNDKDAFPDDEDRCPNQPAASQYSTDGC